MRNCVSSPPYLRGFAPPLTDASYQGIAKREDAKDIQANWHVAMRPGKRLAARHLVRIEQPVDGQKAHSARGRGMSATTVWVKTQNGSEMTANPAPTARKTRPARTRRSISPAGRVNSRRGRGYAVHP